MVCYFITPTCIFSDIYYTLVLIEHKLLNQSVEDSNNSTSYQILPVHNLRWLITNIKEGDILQGNTVYEYNFIPQMEKGEDILLVYTLLQQKELLHDTTGLVPEDCTEYR